MYSHAESIQNVLKIFCVGAIFLENHSFTPSWIGRQIQFVVQGSLVSTFQKRVGQKILRLSEHISRYEN